jgi:hypothetical protein
MSSVTRFIKQVTPGLNIIVPPALSTIYEFVPSASNTTGNYPPGVMVLASNSPSLLAYLTAVGWGPYANGSTISAGWSARDMGKTIKTGVATTETGTAVVNTEQHFRQIQLVRPVLGNTDGAFGVQGAATVPNSVTDYLTVYIPVSVTFGGNLASNATVVVGGQM